MVKQKMLEILEMDFVPDPEGKRISRRIRRARVIRPDRTHDAEVQIDGGLRPSTESTRNRVVLQEMRLFYNQLVGTGDQLVDMKLATVLARFSGVAGLSRVELQAINYDLARQVSEIFGHQIARRAYDHIGGVIAKAFS